MKKKALLLGSLPALALASGIFLSNSVDSEGKYEQRLSSHLEDADPTIDGTYEYYHLLKGDFTKEDWERSKGIANSVAQDRATFSWIDLGPDNVGGRTRAIVIDRENINHLFAGSVSGGLYESINRSSTWSRVEEFDANLAISSMCQTIDGTFYAATGHQREQNGGSQNAYESGANGYGVYKRSSDGSWSLIEGTENYNYINEVRCDDVNNMVWIASSSGLKKYNPADNTVTDVDAFGGFGVACNSLSLSKDGNVMIGHATGGGPAKVLVSNDGGSSFTEVSGDEDDGLISLISVGRIEFAISHEKVDGDYRVYGSAASGQLEGIWRSADNGNTWSRIAPAYDGTPGGFAPFTSGGSSGQGLYDNIITVVPGAPDRIMLGGIDCYTWSTTGNWEQVSQWFLDPVNPKYVHADNHEFVWDSWGRLYIGNDGGVAFSDNAATLYPEFHPANRGYNVTQFFASGVSAHGDVIGGAQDNGTNANYHTGTTWQEHKEVGGGDGFSCDISFINRNLMFGSVYYSSVYRSSDRGENGSIFVPDFFFTPSSPCTIGAIDGSGCGQFFTNFEIWEHPNDLASTDTLNYIASESFNEGDIVEVPSATSQTYIPYESPIDIVFDDTLFYDPSETFDDTVVVDLLTEADFNLGILSWEFISGASEISEGDSILIIGVEENDTIIVDTYTTQNHYVGTNDLKPGEFIDMGNDSMLFNIAWDTLNVQDPYQSWFALDMGGSNGIWLTRQALRFSATENGWFNITNSAEGGISTGSVASMEFSKDGEYLFIGTWTGQLFRYTGYNSAYTPAGFTQDSVVGGVSYGTLYDWDSIPHITQIQQIGSFGAPVTGIASGAIDDPDHLVVTLGNYSGSGKVRESINATGASPDFNILSAFPTSGDGASSIGIPAYSVIIDRDDPDVIVVGTEFGVFATENGGTSWENVSGGLGEVPVYDMQQNWRTWDEGCKRPGEIYVGTHGRGIWSSEAYLNLPDGDNLDKDKFQTNINLYPNPLKDQGTVEFDLESNGDVTLQIFNLNGQLVNQVVSKDLQAGKNQIAFDANALPKGTYILRLNSETMSETTKFIKH